MVVVEHIRLATAIWLCWRVRAPSIHGTLFSICSSVICTHTQNTASKKGKRMINCEKNGMENGKWYQLLGIDIIITKCGMVYTFAWKIKCKNVTERERERESATEKIRGYKM